jgi:type 1 fimbria pilin
MGSRALRTGVSGAVVLVAVLALAAPASAASIVVQPSSVGIGGTVTISGDVLADGTPGCTVPGTVTLISPAFVGLGEFAGEGAVELPVDASGSFSGPVHLSSSIGPGTYSISARCGGGNLGVSATLTVTGLARTGATLGRHDLSAVSAIGLLAIALGFALVAASRRRAARVVGR